MRLHRRRRRVRRPGLAARRLCRVPGNTWAVRRRVP